MCEHDNNVFTLDVIGIHDIKKRWFKRIFLQLSHILIMPIHNIGVILIVFCLQFYTIISHFPQNLELKTTLKNDKFHLYWSLLDIEQNSTAKCETDSLIFIYIIYSNDVISNTINVRIYFIALYWIWFQIFCTVFHYYFALVLVVVSIRIDLVSKTKLITNFW